MKNVAFFLLISLFVTTDASFAQNRKKQHSKNTKTVMSIKSEYQLKIGTSINIALQSLAIAGYLWTYELADKNIVEIEKVENSKYISDGAIGQSTDECFKIIAKNKGTTNIVFVQRRPWETDTSANSKKAMKVVVE